MSARRRFAAVFLPLAAAACGNSPAAPAIDPPDEYITVRHAWRPGERDSAVAAIVANGALGQFSAMADAILARDSATDIVRNPLAAGPARAFPLLVLAPTSGGMQMAGVDLYQVDATSPAPSPTDTTMWLMAFWYNTAEPTWHGYTVMFSRFSTGGPVTLNTTTFDASGGRTGGGGGEARGSTGEYWEATAGTFQVTSNSARGGAPSVITTGPFAGGTQRSGTIAGRLRFVRLTKVLPAPGTNQSFSLDFRGSPVAAVRISCTWTGASCT